MSPEQAQQLSPEQMQEIAAHAEREQPEIVEQMGKFAAQHPTLVKTLGTAALGIALSNLRNHATR